MSKLYECLIGVSVIKGNCLINFSHQTIFSHSVLFLAKSLLHVRQEKMPKRNDIHKIMIMDFGPIIIGQACKALKSFGYEIVLVASH
jgi:hypothetical protein